MILLRCISNLPVVSTIWDTKDDFPFCASLCNIVLKCWLELTFMAIEDYHGGKISCMVENILLIQIFQNLHQNLSTDSTRWQNKEHTFDLFASKATGRSAGSVFSCTNVALTKNNVSLLILFWNNHNVNSQTPVSKR